jgi:predicted small lipoprotein YifL
MLRELASSLRFHRIAACALVLALCAACGIKGPLRLPPPPETPPSAPAAAPAPAPSSGASAPAGTAPSEEPPPKAK